jgi:RecA-family ATPase
MNAAPKFGPSTFEAFWHLGYGPRLLPIVPPTADISERSTLHKRVGTPQDGRGKTPGVRGKDGKWHSFDWQQHETLFDDLARWAAMGAGVGCRMGAGLAAIDADTLDKTLAGLIQQCCVKHFSVLSTRIGNWPKALYLIRVSGPFPYKRVEFGNKERVEILTEGKQAVFAGVHPKTGAPYLWPFQLKPFDELPIVSPEQLTAFLNELSTILPAAKPVVTEGAGNEVSQASLRGELNAVRKAVAALPNTSEAFPTRETWYKVGYAIKGALQDYPQEAFNLFAEWSAKWTENGKLAKPGNDPAYVEAEWARFKPPFKVGASFLFETAETHAPDAFKKVDAFFDVLPDEPESLFAAPAVVTAVREVEPLICIDPTTWAGRSPQPREWVVDGWMPKGEVTLLYGDGGVGKSLIAMQFATCAATNRPWLGQNTRPSRVMGFFCEDGEDELFRRQADINKALGVEFADLTDLRLISRKHFDNTFALWDRQTGALKLQPVWHQLVTAAKAFRADVLIVDTIADVFAGSEIDRAQVSAFVKSCLGRMAQEIGGSVLALGHPSLSGKSSGSGTSGSTAWSNAARSRLYLKHPKGSDRGNTRVLEGMKANYGPKGSELIIRWHRGAFEMVAGSQPAVSSATLGARAIVSIAEAVEQAIVTTLAANPALRMTMASNSQYRAEKVLRQIDPDAFAAYDRAKVEAAMQALLRREALREDWVGDDGNGHKVKGYVIVPDNLTASPPLAPTHPDTPQIFD